MAEADRKTEQARKRLAETQEELSTEVSGKADKVHELGEKIGEALARAEQLGAEGLVDESMKLMEEIDALRKQKSEAESDYRSSIPAATYQQQKLRVCDVCCAYLGIHDNDRRLADHFGGKLHLGFIKIRETLKEFQVFFVSVISSKCINGNLIICSRFCRKLRKSVVENGGITCVSPDLTRRRKRVVARENCEIKNDLRGKDLTLRQGK